jgi:hypothetical protein
VSNEEKTNIQFGHTAAIKSKGECQNLK